MESFIIEKFYVLFQGIITFQAFFLVILFFISKRKDILFYALYLLFTAIYFFWNAPNTFFGLNENEIFETLLYIYVNTPLIIVCNLLYVYFLKYFFYDYLHELFLDKIINWLVVFCILLIITSLCVIYFQYNNQPIFYIINFIGTFFGFYILYKIKNIKNDDLFWISIGIKLNILGNAITIGMIVLDRNGYHGLYTTSYPLLFMRFGILFDILFYMIAILKKWQMQENALISQKMESVLVIEKLRNKIAADLHDEVGSTLNSIGISTKIIQKKVKDFDPELQTILSQMETDSDETISMIRDTVWALNPENDSLDILIEKTHNFARQILGNKEISLIFDNKIVKNKTVKLNIDNQKNFFLIAKEAINNIAKHSEATEAKMTYKMKDGMIHFEISDNGNGYDISKNFEGNGLKNFQKRANESFMDLKIESKPQQGTKIKLVVPII